MAMHSGPADHRRLPHRPFGRFRSNVLLEVAPRLGRLGRLMLLGLIALPSAPALAQASSPLSPPRGDVLLIVDGDIANPNVGDEAHLDAAQLAALPRHAFTTHTPWSDGPQRFEGPLLSAVLELVGASGSRFEAIALDDYQISFEGVDLERYPVIIADRHDGEPMSVRRLGPLRIVMPFDDHEALRTRSNEAMSVWQLLRMTVR